MAKKESTKSRIAVVAWKLFHEKGYENTTIDEIILQSGTSKGSFYHYYSGKDELLGALADVFDSWYEEFIQEMNQEMDSYEKLISLCVRVHERIEEEIPVQLLSSLYSAQVVTKGDSASGEPEPLLLPHAPPAGRRRTASRSDHQRPSLLRSRQDLHHLRAGNHLRLLYFRRQLFPRRLHPQSDAHAVRRSPGERTGSSTYGFRRELIIY